MSEVLKDEKAFESILENIAPVAREDIQELATKITSFRKLEIDDEKFRAFRLARGVYGQRQEGVQMIRIKLPYGKVSPDQLIRIADIADRYASHNLHLTTRQDVQIHYVKLENTPKVWAELEEVGITLREACGNTVRNVTGSALAGIDANEPFDITPYAHEHFEYFLRNPICQEMGRKFKISFSSSIQDDSAFGFIHDIGFIPVLKNEKRGFKVLIAGGLGAQPFLALTAYEFLEENQIIPFTEAVIRVFDRNGERTKRHKARLKYLVNGMGLDAFMKLVEQEQHSIKTKSYSYDHTKNTEVIPTVKKSLDIQTASDHQKFERWEKTNVFEQKQIGNYGVYIKQHLGDMSSEVTRKFAPIVKKYASDDIRITVNQGWLLKYVNKEELPALFNALNEIGLAEPGFDSTADITACPGTDTCNLGIASSTGLSAGLEKMLLEEYPDIIFNRNIKIKISGCMNACGQHTIANIGFHGMSMKNGAYVLPAMQVMLGGGIEADGSGSLADKVVKVPSKRCPDVVRALLNDYEGKGIEGEYFNDYYRRHVAEEKMYFYKLLKPFAELTTLADIDYIDWGHDEKYVTAVGVGECAGVMLDLVATLLNDTEDKLKWAIKGFDREAYADAIYSAYATCVSGAKALLTGEGINCNTQLSIINDFEEHLVKTGKFVVPSGSFSIPLLRMSSEEPTKEFAKQYLEEAKEFVAKIKEFRTNTVKVAL